MPGSVHDFLERLSLCLAVLNPNRRPTGPTPPPSLAVSALGQSCRRGARWVVAVFLVIVRGLRPSKKCEPSVDLQVKKTAGCRGPVQKRYNSTAQCFSPHSTSPTPRGIYLGCIAHINPPHLGPRCGPFPVDLPAFLKNVAAVPVSSTTVMLILKTSHYSPQTGL